MPLVNRAVRRAGEELFQIQQQYTACPPKASEVPVQMVLETVELPVESLALLARPVVIDHGRAIEGN